MSISEGLLRGVRNLLVHCARLSKGERLLVIREDTALGWYDERASQAVIDLARDMGIEPDVLDVGGPQGTIDAAIARAVRSHDCTIFFARIGDQERFSELPAGCRSVMVYARDAASLGSPFGTADHNAMTDLKRSINELLADAGRIEITCPLGTRFSGTPATVDNPEPADVSVARFPLSVPAPVPAAEFSGRVALVRYLTTTGSMPYEPASVPIDDIVFAEVVRGRIERFTGTPAAVGRVERHYDHVAALFDIDRNAVHSWHAGLHPACSYHGNIEDDPDRWSNNIFGSPRFLHFHTCGDYAPGEICWMVLDATIALDGIPLWEDGRLCLRNFEATTSWLARHPQLSALFDDPKVPIGL